ncbi:integrator complex subunit 1 [Pseudonaja textilis]|uniref:integrator complex subunit 1 n=1 Tax=Pseudonaja textilis TaxID=8673 RepID=UPI000EA9DDA8|nr:integrator complex subunit 1 [Pseudonaja textilis]
MNRTKPAAARRPSAVSKPSGHPPPGDFIALGSKGQVGESKATATLLKPTSSGLPSERKRESATSALSSTSGLAKRPKLSSTPPLSALGRLAEAAVAEKRAISPSIKEPSVIPIEVAPNALLDEIESAEAEGNDDRIEGVLCGAVKQLKMNRAKPDITLYLTLMYLAKIKPNIFATEGVIEALCSLLRRDASINFKAKGNSLVSVLACNLLMAAYEEDENWPEIFVKVYMEDSLGERIWVDSPHCKTFVENIQTAFGTKMPPKSIMSHGEVGRGGGDLSAGNSPHPSVPEEEDSQSELLIAEDKMSPEQEAHLMPRYDDLAESVEEYVLDMLRDQLNRRQPMDNVSRNLLRLLTATCGYKEIRQMAVQRLEMWLQNPKLTRPAQDLLMSVCMNCNTHSSEDVEVVSNLIKIRLKPKVLLNHYMLCVRELLNAHQDNLGTVVKSVIFNELSNARNPNNMQILYTVLQHSPELAPKFLAMVFQDLLTNKDDYLRASRALLREIIKQTKHEINFQAFCLGLMQERKLAQYADMEFKDRFVIHITDLLAVSMMLGITAQVKEAGVAWDKGEKKNLEGLRAFQNQIAAIQRDAVWWLHMLVPSITKLAPKEYIHCLHKVLFTEQPETYYKWDNWPPESDRNFFLRLCSEVPILEDTLMRILVIGLSRDLPLGPADAMELADHLVKRAAAVQADDLEVLRVERIQLIDAVLNLCTYHHPENIQLPPGYHPPNLAISTLYWKAWPLLLVVAAFNPENIGLTAWEDYPTLKMLMEMVMTNNYSYPPCTLTDEETRTEMISRELQISQREKQEILAFEGHLAAASTKQTITESSSLLLSQLTSLDPQGPPRRPPQPVLDQVKSLNQSLRLGHLLCRSRHPDFLLNIIQRQASSQSMPWLADLVQSSEGSLDVLPVQCLCEFLLHDAADESASGEEEEEGESKEQRAKKRQRQQKQRQLLGRLQDMLLGPTADEQTTCEVLDYFLRRLSSSQVASRVLAMKGLSLVLSEGALPEKEEKEHPMEEDPWDFKLLQSYQWLLRDLPKLPLFDSVRTTTAVALQQAVHMETDPQTISAYLVYLSQHAPVEEQGQHNNLALDVARLIVERSTIMSHLFSKLSYCLESDSVLVALLSIFSRYIKRMRQTKEGDEVYNWSESQDQVFLRWSGGETATMHILVVHAMVILLTLGPPQGEGRLAVQATHRRHAPQDEAFSSLFFKVLMQMLQWLESPGVEDSLLRTQLKSFAVQFSSQHRISDAQVGFLHLADALAFCHNSEVIGSTVRAIVSTLKSSKRWNVDPELVSKVLEGLTKTRSPYLEELLVTLFSVATEMTPHFPTSGPISVVTSLLLQCRQESCLKKEAENSSVESASGLFIDWLELLDPEVVSSCPDLQQKLLFSRDKGKDSSESEPLSFRPYLLALLTHQSSWTTLHCCIRTLLCRSQECSFDPTASLDFLWACIHMPRIWQGRDQRIPQKRREEFVLRLKSPELLSLVELILAESESRSTNPKETGCSVTQSRLPLLLSCCHGNTQRIQKVTEHLISSIQKWGKSSMGRHCQDLLLQMYLQLPELLVPRPETLLSCEGATDSSPCKLDSLIHRFITLLADAGDVKMSEGRLWDANMACRKLAVAHPILLLRHLPMIAALLHGRIHLNFQEFRQQKHLAFFLHVLGILELLQPQVFQNEHQGAMWDCLLSFIQLLLSYRKSSRHLACFITKFVQFIHKYITSNAPAAVSFLQKHSSPLHDLSSDNNDLAMLKSLLAGLSLPSRAGASDRGAEDEKNDEAAAGSLPLVSVSLFTPLTPAEMAPYMKSLSRGQNVEDILEVLTDIDEMARRRPEILAFFSTHLQKLMNSEEEACRNLAFNLALRSIQNNPSIAADFLPTFMYCLGSCDFEVVQTALRNLPEYTLLCQEHAAALLQRAFLVGMYGQMDTSTQISEALKILHMEAMM